MSFVKSGFAGGAMEEADPNQSNHNWAEHTLCNHWHIWDWARNTWIQLHI